MPLVKVLRHGQVTLPKEFRERLDIKEGDYLEAEMGHAGVFIKPKAVVDREEAVLSPAGKKKIMAALQAFKEGKFKEFEDVDDLIKELNS